MAIVTYYFDGYAAGVEEWNKNPANMADGDIETFAEEDGSVTVTQSLDGNSCDGTDLGSITAVEIRAYCKGDIVGYRITLTPDFILTGDGDSHEITMDTSPDWSEWFDITNDTNAPVWDWSEVGDNLHCDVMNVETGCFCAKVEIKVTYTSAFKRGWWSK